MLAKRVCLSPYTEKQNSVAALTGTCSPSVQISQRQMPNENTSTFSVTWSSVRACTEAHPHFLRPAFPRGGTLCTCAVVEAIARHTQAHTPEMQAYLLHTGEEKLRMWSVWDACGLPLSQRVSHLGPPLAHAGDDGEELGRHPGHRAAHVAAHERGRLRVAIHYSEQLSQNSRRAQWDLRSSAEHGADLTTVKTKMDW